ncbi:MAG: hypothetical protein J7578_23575 [Chitinophagaceae bacterium]|nr:hypothetical protein [Chitinophagaceae bacterium]
MNRIFLFYLVGQVLTCCETGPSQTLTGTDLPKNFSPTLADTSIRTIHVMVALCDNKYQGIVPVPAAIGNGQDPDNNLYWGCPAGIRSYFKKSKEWELVKRYKVDKTILERAVFKHRAQKYYLVADAYDGRHIRQCTIDFLKSCSGQLKDTLQVSGHIPGINGNAKLVAYIGHDGLMDFSLDERFQHTDSLKRDAIMLACISKRYFAPHLAQTGAQPLVWTTGLMCPEAYTLHDALSSYIRKESTESIRSHAAKAYAKYQRCSEKAARNLLVSGW